MIELKRQEEYIKMVKREYLPFWQSLLMLGSSKRENYFDIFDCSATINHYLVCDGDIYYVKSELNEIAQETINIWRDFEKFKKLRKKILEKEKEVLGVVEADLRDFVDPFEKYMPLLISILVIENLIEEDLRKALSEKIGESEAEKYLDKLNTPLDDNFYKKEEYDLVNAKDISAHVKEYEWIKSRYGKIDPYTEKEAKEKLKNINKEEFLLEWEESKKELKKTIRKAKEILGKEKRHLVDVMQFIVFYRTQRTDIINKVIYSFAPTLEKMANDLGLTYEQILHCTKDELLENKIPSIDEIQERMKGFSMIANKGRVECYFGKDHQKIADFFKKDLSNISEIKGFSACRGNVQGKARIVLGINDFEKVGEGDVLVASMTTPNFVPVMKSASAFVTDEGGITCHAAIISREMKKPCIIGTKIATQVLKDGDLVEVDANEGVVRILEKVGGK